MWTAIAGVLGAAVALSVVQTYLQDGNQPPADQARKGPVEGLPEPDRNAKPRPKDGTFSANLWQEISPQVRQANN